MSRNKYTKNNQKTNKKSISENQQPVIKTEHQQRKQNTGFSNGFYALYLKYPHWFWLAGIIILTFIAYFPNLDNDFVNWDDDRYVTLNMNIQVFSFKNIIKYFTDYYFVLYLPLPLLTYAIEHYFFGLNPFIYHFTNVLIHLINTGLVFMFVYKLIKFTSGKRYLEIAVVTALLFGVNTFHVQSIAWISETKDVLYSMFYLWALIKYLDFLKTGKQKYYFVTLGIFLLSLFSKGQAVTLSVVLLVLDYYFDRNLFSKKVIIEKIPFFILSLIFGIINLMAYSTQEPFLESTAQIVTPSTRTFIENILYSCYGYIVFILKTFIPYKLAVIYPYPEKINDTIQFYFWLFPIPVTIITASIVYFWKKSKEIVFGILFYSISITLILQIIADQPFIIADHYSYLSSVGILFIVGVGTMKLIDYKEKLKIPVFVGIAVFTLFHTVYTMQRSDVWQNSETLWSDEIEKYNPVTVAHYNRGNFYQEQGDRKAATSPDSAKMFYEKAIKDYTNAIYFNSKEVGAFSNRGITRAKLGDAKGALIDFNSVVGLDSNYANVYSNRGNTKIMLGDFTGAISDYNRALKQKPDYIDALSNRGNALLNKGNYTEALADYEKLIQLQPKTALYYVNKGLCLLNLNRLDESLIAENTAIELDPKSYSAYYFRAIINERKGNKESASKDYKMAVQINPKLLQNLIENGNKFENSGNIPAAIAEYNKAIQIAPDYSEAYSARGVAIGKSGDLKGAINDFNKAIELNPNNAFAFSNRGFAKNIMNDYKGALADFDKAISLNQNFSNAYFNRGLVKRKLGNFEEAITDFDIVVKLNPNFLETYYYRGLCKYAINQRQEGCNDLKFAVQNGLTQAQKELNLLCK